MKTFHAFTRFRLWVLLALTFGSGMGQAQEASLEGSILQLPVVEVDTVRYRVELLLLADSDPSEFQLLAAELLTDNSAATASYSEGVLTIPRLAIDGLHYTVNLGLFSEDPISFRLLDSVLAAAEPEPRIQALEIFEFSLSTNVVQSRCIGCHVEGGVAENSNLLFTQQSASSTSSNFAAFESLLNSRSDGREHILSRVSGTDHPGGNQLPIGSAEYLALESMLLLLEGNTTPTTTQTVQFFSSVTSKDAAETLRKAAIMLGGRLPTSEEVAGVASGDDAALRAALRNLMQGESFHEFLLEGANDQLLIRGIRDSDLLLDGCEVCFPTFLNRFAELRLAEEEQGGELGIEAEKYVADIDRGLIEAPLELIAYVVENDRPYSEVLTADYIMLNPAMNSAMEGTARFQNPSDMSEYQPGRITGAYVPTEDMEFEELEEIELFRITDPGSGRLDFPHAGVLNTIGFLKRYPSTATNRNRARARWTFFHFLGIDIERSAPRTTDPVALADTNNPTMFNENCTVCHTTLDPVAGAFQNYSDDGFYRVEGLDSLDEFYKYPEDGTVSPYIEGDTWYRDMREPGIFGNNAPHSDNSVQWLADQIVNDPGFASAAVKFWWPAVIGTEVLGAPEVATDGDYQAQLDAFNAQNQTIQELAASFSSNGLLLKDLLVEMMMTPWFRGAGLDASSQTSQLLAAHEQAEFGSEKLLTPERLQTKTHVLTGFNWNAFQDEFYGEVITGFGDIYGLFYGGTNSSSITERARVMTPLMSTVAMSHALESACPIVLKEFILPSNQRLLFEGIEDSVTPENGEAEIRQKLVQLHERLLGKTYASNSEEINAAYQLFVDSRQERISASGG
ncbi:MAG: DUF1588 domain-containing protein, partial [Pseudomonadales bacterium]|nr:DUF1588 domain-containing protein [Pseudomonadales bacterium]